MGSILERARTDAKNIINAIGFQLDIEIFNPDKSLSVSVKGWGVKHSLSFDTDGNQTNSKTARVTVYEQDLIDAGMVVRNAKKDVTMDKYKVIFKDSSGEDKKYSVRETFPNENLGVIVLMLQDAIF